MDDVRVNVGLGLELAAARAGDRSALGRVLQGCRAYLLTFANAELNADLAAKEGASDLVQQSLLEAQQAFSRFGGTNENELLRWLRRIVKNNLLDVARRYRDTAARGIDQEISLERVEAKEFTHQLADGQRSPVEGLLALEKKIALESGLACLPEEFRRVIELRHSQGQTFAEIGVALGKSAEAAQALVSCFDEAASRTQTP